MQQQRACSRQKWRADRRRSQRASPLGFLHANAHILFCVCDDALHRAHALAIPHRLDSANARSRSNARLLNDPHQVCRAPIASHNARAACRWSLLYLVMLNSICNPLLTISVLPQVGTPRPAAQTLRLAHFSIESAGAWTRAAAFATRKQMAKPRSRISMAAVATRINPLSSPRHCSQLVQQSV